jgi:hypothetical protein
MSQTSRGGDAKTPHLVLRLVNGNLRRNSHGAGALGEHPGRELLQTLIGRQQLGRFSPGQSQIVAVVNGMVKVAGQSQCFHLQMTVSFDYIHQLSCPAQARLQTIGWQLAGPLQAPEGIGHLGEHQLRGQHQIRSQHSLLKGGHVLNPLDDSNHR